MNLIQVFWFVALAVAERMAMLPSLLICFASVCTSVRPRSSAEAWLMNMLRPSGAVSESYVTTLMPEFIAFLSAGTTAFVSLAEIAIAPTFCVVSVLMYGTCAVGDVSDGPTRLNFAPRPSTAVLPPLSEMVKYGLLSCLGRNATVTSEALLVAAAVAAAEVAVLAALSVLFFVEPHAATISTGARTPRRASLETIDVDISLLTGMLMGWWWSDCAAAIRAHER